jgi:hypothetical protein
MRYITVFGFKAPDHPTLVNIDEIIMVLRGPAVSMTPDEVNEAMTEVLQKEFSRLEVLSHFFGKDTIDGMKAKARVEAAKSGEHMVKAYICLRDGSKLGVMDGVTDIVAKLDEVNDDEFEEDAY